MKTLSIATKSQQKRQNAKLLIIHPDTDERVHLPMSAFWTQLRTGDVLVVNNSATLPASFKGIHRESGQPIELRLASALSVDMQDIASWKGVLFGQGTWQMETEKRTKVPDVQAGDHLDFKSGLTAVISHIEQGRLLTMTFQGSREAIWHQIYQAGRLIQYSYLEEELDLWDGQTLFASRPVSVEPPSSGFPFNWQTLLKIKKQGIHLVALTHAAGISSTGDPELDRLLPLPERYCIPEHTALMVNQALYDNRRVIAIGTSVTRALESAALPDGQGILAGCAMTQLVITSDYKRRIVSGLLTGLHESGSSHLKLLSNFAPLPLIQEAYAEAMVQGYLWHEYGDSCLIV